MNTFFSSVFEAFSQPFMQRAVLGGMLAGATVAYIGVFAVLRRITFVGIALAQISGLGAALGTYYGIDPHTPAFAITVLAALALPFLGAERRVPREAVVGVLYAAAGGLAVILLSQSAQGEAETMNLLFGNILTVTDHDLEYMVLTSIGIAILFSLFHKEFVLIAFDPETAAASGIPVRTLDLLFHGALGLAVAASLKVAGVLVIFGAIVLPASTALSVMKRVPGVLACAVITTVISVLVGLYLSFQYDLPSGPAVVGVMTLFLIPAGAWFRFYVRTGIKLKV